MLFKSKHNIAFPDISVYEFIFEGEKEFSQDKLAFVNAEDKSESITFGELKSLTLRFGAGLQRLTDFKKGDVVAIYSPNDIYYVPILHGTAAVGGIVASIDSTCDANSAVKLLRTVNAKYIVAHPDTLERAIQAARTIGIPSHRIFVLGKNDINGISCVENQFWGTHEELAIPVKYTKEELATTACYYYFTSGTTSDRKAVIQTQRSMLCAIASKLTWFPTYTNVLAQKYFHHGSSLTFVLHFNVIYGCTTYVMKEDYGSFEKLLVAIQDCKIHGFTTQPWVAASLAKEPIVNKYDISSLEWVISAGYAVDRDMCTTFFNKLGIPCISAFGMTESLSSFEGSASCTLAGQIGTLSPNCSCKLINENGEEVGYNEVGELLFKGPALTPGYLNNPEANAQAFDDEGFYHTGDLMKVDENGVFSYVDRAKDVIRYGDHVIFPQDIERVLISHSLVTDCAVIGAYSQKKACRIATGFVTLTENNDGKNLEEVKNEILKIAKTQLTPEKQLHGGLYILENLPRTSTGKINRSELRNYPMYQRVMSLEIKS